MRPWSYVLCHARDALFCAGCARQCIPFPAVSEAGGSCRAVLRFSVVLTACHAIRWTSRRRLCAIMTRINRVHSPICRFAPHDLLVSPPPRWAARALRHEWRKRVHVHAARCRCVAGAAHCASGLRGRRSLRRHGTRRLSKLTCSLRGWRERLRRRLLRPLRRAAGRNAHRCRRAWVFSTFCSRLRAARRYYARARVTPSDRLNAGAPCPDAAPARCMPEGFRRTALRMRSLWPHVRRAVIARRVVRRV